MEDEWLLKARPGRVEGHFAPCQNHYLVLCACALSNPHPITFRHKNRLYKTYVNTLL